MNYTNEGQFNDLPLGHRYVKGIGPTKSRELTKIGIATVGDLLCRHPLSYLYLGGVAIAEAKEGNVIIKARIEKIGYAYSVVTEATLVDGTGTCKAQWYNARYVRDQLRPGMTVIFWGKLKGNILQQPKWTTVDSSLRNVVGGQYGTHHDTIRAALKEVMHNTEDLDLPDINYGCSRRGLFIRYHFPEHKEEQWIALCELKQDEAFQLQLALAERRRGREQGTTRPIACNGKLDTKIMRTWFPYRFTHDQTTAVRTVIDDLSSSIPMQRLIHGEVGSGKTAVAFYAAMLAALNGKRTLILCPTTILAAQHYDTLRGMGWEDVSLFNGEDTWNANIIIGTHSILHDEELLRTPSLVIIDEFQKFGVEQRARIQQNNPHLLLLSATPIPRTLASTVFGDLDVSVIRELPIKRGTVITKQVLPDRKEAMWDIVEKELVKGHQAYIVYPRISGDEDVVSAERGFKELHKRFYSSRHSWDQQYFPQLLTGKTESTMKAAILREFRQGDIPILVSTIIAEVGLDNPNATVMVIEGADRFGLSQLHQLRGRVCRSTDTAFCFLVSMTANPTSIARLEVIEKCTDGFEISEHDLRLRGAGEVFSTRQHGLPDLKFVSLVDDYDLMIEAKELVASGDVGDG